MAQKSGYSYRDEFIHVVDIMAAAQKYFDCRKCGRNLCEDQFTRLSSLNLLVRGSSDYRSIVPVHPYCHRCREVLRDQAVKHPLYTPALDKFFKALCTRMASAARGRGLMFGVDKDDILGLYLGQGGKCALSGIELDWKEKGFSVRGGRALARPSIDRIDSNGNYVIGNVQVVANIINIMKSDLAMEQFEKLCCMVAENSFTKALELQTAAA